MKWSLEIAMFFKLYKTFKRWTISISDEYNSDTKLEKKLSSAFKEMPYTQYNCCNNNTSIPNYILISSV